ncbi:hypothetical protein L484_016203 [Morus notabilis]|uniref:Jacalin-type lectin domain-containing protein n=1 Tax=Morus notabilis TaxID=981085 RepID=W9RWV0_9ROSA|nr:hypothetical protein L484_016203 [Morus notabilis]
MTKRMACRSESSKISDRHWCSLTKVDLPVASTRNTIIGTVVSSNEIFDEHRLVVAGVCHSQGEGDHEERNRDWKEEYGKGLVVQQLGRMGPQTNNVVYDLDNNPTPEPKHPCGYDNYLAASNNPTPEPTYDSSIKWIGSLCQFIFKNILRIFSHDLFPKAIWRLVGLNFLATVRTLKLIGPYGGTGGQAWDHGSTHTGIRKIFLTHKEGEKGGIGSFRVFYSDNPSLPYEHLSGDDTFTQVNLDLDADEVITKVSGYTGVVPGARTRSEVVRGLAFSTNKSNTYEYGVAEGTHFSSPSISSTTAKIVGFIGRTSSDYLNAIGFHLLSYDTA